MPMIELFEGFYVRIGREIAFAVVAASEDGKSCAAFTDGQSAVGDAFTLPYPAEEVAEKLNDAEQELFEEDVEEDDEEE